MKSVKTKEEWEFSVAKAKSATKSVGVAKWRVSSVAKWRVESMERGGKCSQAKSEESENKRRVGIQCGQSEECF